MTEYQSATIELIAVNKQVNTKNENFKILAGNKPDNDINKQFCLYINRKDNHFEFKLNMMPLNSTCK